MYKSQVKYISIFINIKQSLKKNKEKKIKERFKMSIDSTKRAMMWINEGTNNWTIFQIESDF